MSVDPVTPVADLRWRQRAAVEGRIRSICVQPRAGIPTLEATIWDATGGVTAVWLGRRSITGIHPGAGVRLEGMLSDHHGKLTFLNPATALVVVGDHPSKR